VESDIPQAPKGLTLTLMFTFDFDPADPNSYGNTQRYITNWIDFGTGLSPFLNEGILMTNVRLRE